MADWATISALATAGGTLVLAGATFASVRSANRAARAAENSMLAGLRPLLIRPHPSSRPRVTRSRHASVWSSTSSTATTKAGSASSRASR
jgi:hypothetical protein